MPPFPLPTLPCHACGYDLRAQPEDGRCPECGASVAESRRLGAIPRRPAWRDSDPRWRRRMLAGAWVLAMIPLFAVLRQSGVADPLPAMPGFQHTIQTFDDTFLTYIDPLPTFCIGAVLLFSRERGRRGGRLDWTRRWGVLGSYLVVLLGILSLGLIAAWIVVGIAALFYSMPIQNQPAIGPVLAYAGAAYLHYLPTGGDAAPFAVSAASAAVMLLACAPLYDALRSSGPRWLAITLLTPFGIAAAVQLAVAALAWFQGPYSSWSDLPLATPFFFNPESVATKVTGASLPFWAARGLPVYYSAYELAKWLVPLLAAAWLTAAQLAALRDPRTCGAEE